MATNASHENDDDVSCVVRLEDTAYNTLRQLGLELAAGATAVVSLNEDLPGHRRLLPPLGKDKTGHATSSALQLLSHRTTCKDSEENHLNDVRRMRERKL
ncbi:hypothetical protein Cadr_000001107, partial [Camelus dromedarius]